MAEGETIGREHPWCKITKFKFYFFVVLSLRVTMRRTWAVNCSIVNEEIVSQIKKWTTDDNCKQGGEKCLYMVSDKKGTFSQFLEFRGGCLMLRLP